MIPFLITNFILILIIIFLWKKDFLNFKKTLENLESRLQRTAVPCRIRALSHSDRLPAPLRCKSSQKQNWARKKFIQWLYKIFDGILIVLIIEFIKQHFLHWLGF